MKTSKHGVEFIASFEGFRAETYKDSGGIPTIGFGHTGPGVKLGKITRAKALQLLAGDVRTAEAAVNQMPVKLNQNQYDAIVSAAFNCGGGILAKGKSLGDALRGKGMKGVPKALSLYVRDAHGTVLKGLVRRRKAEAALFLKPVVSGPAAWLTSGELKRCRELDDLRELEHPSAAQKDRIGVLVRALTKQRKRIWRVAQDPPKGDGHGWDHAHRWQRYKSLKARTA